MKQNKQILLMLISVLLLNGCAVYYPQTTDIPLIKEKKELRVDGGISLFPAINGTVSYGLTDKIAVQVSGNLMMGAAYYSKPLFQYLLTGAVCLGRTHQGADSPPQVALGRRAGHAGADSQHAVAPGSLG